MAEVRSQNTNKLSERCLHSQGCHVEHTKRVWGQLSCNSFDETCNPTGVVNLGTAENHLMSDIMCKRLSQNDVLSHHCQNQMYFPHKGYESIRETMANFVQKRLSRGKTIDKELIVVIAGANAALDSLGFAIADIGDSVMIPAPYYSGIKHYICARSGLTAVTVPVKMDNNVCGSSLDMSTLRSTYAEAKSESRNVRCLFLINPGNPSGQVYSKSDLQVAMDFCHESGFHLIIDETFAFSVHDTSKQFTSILSMDFVEPNMTHAVWSVSKDLGLAGLRAGLIYTRNKSIIEYLDQVSCSFNCVPPIIQQKLTTVLSDEDWLDKEFFPLHYTRLREFYEICKSSLDQMGVSVINSPAGNYVLANFSRFMDVETFEEEYRLFERFMAAGVYLIAGQFMNMPQPGWFRVVFTVPKTHLEKGLRRIDDVLKKENDRVG